MTNVNISASEPQKPVTPQQQTQGNPPKPAEKPADKPGEQQK
jgi:hypothetical protein